jgi:antitoxin (DNA-binding transcriptional repressor) of toxin-antitoxin stability system
MININIHEAKANLPRYLERIAKGETIILCKRNISTAKMRPIPPDRKSQLR